MMMLPRKFALILMSIIHYSNAETYRNIVLLWSMLVLTHEICTDT